MILKKEASTLTLSSVENILRHHQVISSSVKIRLLGSYLNFKYSNNILAQFELFVRVEKVGTQFTADRASSCLTWPIYANELVVIKQLTWILFAEGILMDAV